MAKIMIIDKPKYMKLDGQLYKIDGNISEEDVKWMNSLSQKSYFVLNNTKGQHSDIIGQINNENIIFSIMGGIDYFNKKKYQTRSSNSREGYIDRTFHSVKALTEIIKYFEIVESQIDLNWTETQKAMFIYAALAQDIKYDHDEQRYDNVINYEVSTMSNLKGILRGQLVCSGIALTLKEMFDRLGIECDYQNKYHSHSWNVVKLDGKYYGLDLTWDIGNLEKSNYCDFENFGSHDFYRNSFHRPANGDYEETHYTLSSFSWQERVANFQTIRETITQRSKPEVQNIDELSREEKLKYFPIDRKIRETSIEYMYIAVANFLRQNGYISNEVELIGNVIENTVKASFEDYMKQYYNGYSIDEFRGEDLGISKLKGFKFSPDCNRLDTPNGCYNSYYNVNTLSEEENRMIDTGELYKLLNDNLHDFLINYSVNLLNSVDKLIQDLDSKDELVVDYTYNQLKIFLKIKDFMISNGISNEIVINKFNKVNDVISKFNEKKLDNFKISSLETKRENLKFYYFFLSDQENIRSLFGNSLTDEEWQTKISDYNYMLNILNEIYLNGEYKLYEDDLTEEEIRYLFEMINDEWKGKITHKEAEQKIDEFIDKNNSSKSIVDSTNFNEVKSNEIVEVSNFRKKKEEYDSISESCDLIQRINSQIIDEKQENFVRG